MSDLRPVYIAHQFSAPTGVEMAENRRNAEAWVCWLAREFPIAPVATWITLTARWPESAGLRARGLEIDKALVRLCKEVWMVGGKVSSGMREEAAEARVVHDLTFLGYEAPHGKAPAIREAIARIVGLD